MTDLFRSPITYRSSVLVAVALASCAPPALAQEKAVPREGQDGSAAEQSPASDDIVVTAQKRAASIQDVPLSVTAFSGRELQERQINQLSDIASISPGVSFISSGGGRADLVMRGLATAQVPTDKPTLSGSVGIFFDDIPLTLAGRNPDLQPVDLNRVEVLRGPQGTLYGGNALGGALKLVSNSPTYTGVRYGIGLEGSVTNHAGALGHNATGYINVPLSDTVAIRAVAYHRSSPGYISNLATGNKDVGEREIYGGRLSIGFKPVDGIEIIGKVVYQKFTNEGSEVIERDVPYANPQPVGLQQYRFTDDHNEDTTRIYQLSATANLGFAEIHSSTSYLDRDTDSLGDFTNIIYTFAPGVLSQHREFVPMKQFVQELRLSSTGSGSFEWTVGAFYSHMKLRYDNDVPAPGFEAVTGISTQAFGGEKDEIYAALNRIVETQKAIFGEATYHLTPQLSLTAGARAYEAKQVFDISANGFFNGGETSNHVVTKGKGINPRFIASYKPTDRILISAQAAKGFRLGGGNDNVPVDLCHADLDALGITNPPRSFASDTVWNYELNAKLRFGKVTFNPAVYRVDYRNVQITNTLPSCSFNFVSNTGSARAQGVEFDLSAEVMRGLTVRGGGAYTDAKLTANLPGNVVLKGTRLPLSPRWSGNVSVRYEGNVTADRTLFSQIDVRYMGRVALQLLGPAAPPQIVPNITADYALANLRIGTERDGVQFSIFAENLFDKRAITNQSGTIEFGRAYTIVPPRTVGLSMTINR